MKHLEKLQVDENQIVQHGFDSTFTFRTYKLEILDDVRVQYGATIPTQASRLVFEGASGASTKTIDGLKLSGAQNL